MKVNEIFYSIEGEGIRAGYPCIFIRLYGCNIRCSYCDSRYACEGGEFEEISIPEIMGRVMQWECKRVTITGGEPLIHPGIDKLITEMIDNGYEVNVETNGTQFPKCFPQDEKEYFDPRRNVTIIREKNPGRVFYTMDWKCKSSGMEEAMDINLVNELTEDDVLKFVVGSREDMNGALTVIEQMTSKPHIFFSPIFGQIEAVEIVDYLKEKKLNDCRVQLQMHKFIWKPEERGV